MRWYASKRRKKSLQMTSERAGWQSRISDAVSQCVPGHRTRNREGPTAELRATVAWNDELVAAYWQHQRPVCRDPIPLASITFVYYSILVLQIFIVLITVLLQINQFFSFCSWKYHWSRLSQWIACYAPILLPSHTVTLVTLQYPSKSPLWSKNTFVSFCQRAPRYGLTMWRALGILVEGTIQVPQLQLQFSQQLELCLWTP